MNHIANAIGSSCFSKAYSSPFLRDDGVQNGRNTLNTDYEEAGRGKEWHMSHIPNITTNDIKLADTNNERNNKILDTVGKEERRKRNKCAVGRVRERERVEIGRSNVWPERERVDRGEAVVILTSSVQRNVFGRLNHYSP